ncbi:DUF4307 domain-containing protein [Janibacter sp. GS2]|uniref:DUF4307 domain-containing protein n=1 Tax=Janibacter sp. GS2 TaxID=3442646 RepID=UPI003EC01809
MTTHAQDHDPWDPEREEAEVEARPGRANRLWWALGGLFVTVGLALTVWFGVSGTEDAITTTDIGFEHPNDREIVMVFDVTRPTGTAISCTVTAMDGQYARVGTAEHEVPADDERTTRVRATVRTTTTAVTATVKDCSAID